MSQVMVIGIVGLVAIAACWGLGVVLYRVSSSDSAGRILAVLLVVEGFTLATAGFPEFTFGIQDSYFELHPNLGWFLGLIHHLSDAAMLSLYPPFLALALNTKLTRPFANKKLRFSLVLGSMLIVFIVTFGPMPFGLILLYSAMTLLFVYALVASIHAWLVASRGITRERAGIFALAFGLRDIGWTFSYAVSAWMIWAYPEVTGLYGLPDIGWLAKLFYALGTLLAVPLIAYGVLRTQLFDIDLRIRWTIKQSTLAAAVVAIMFVLSEGADRLLSSTLGDFAGLWAAALVVFFLAPLQRFAEKISTAAMPNTKNTPEYVTFRKMQVYEAALSEALVEGGISEKERALLIHLRNSLGVSEADAEAIELELKAAQPGLA